MLGALCALRIGEVLALRFEDLDRGILKVQRTPWHGNTSKTKTPSSRRTLKLPQRALGPLERLTNTAAASQVFLFATSSGKLVDVFN